jgi:hypothetical protein
VNQKGIYLYGIMAAHAVPRILPEGIGGEGVYALRCGDFVALVSRLYLDQADFEPEAILAHEQVLSGVMNEGTVLPAAFGHLFPDEEAVRRFVTSAAGELHGRLEYLTGRIEVGVTAVWRKETFLSDIETPDLRFLVDQAQRSPEDASLALAVGELVERLLQQRRSQYVEQICPLLEEAAVEMRLNQPGATRVVFSAAFLIERDALDAFFDHVEQVVKPYEDRLEFTGSGPWPPHNFARLHLDSEG